MSDHRLPEITDVTDASFEQKILRQARPAILSFWASWNAPSAHQQQLVKDLVTEFAPRVVVGRVNVDDSPMVASQYILPTLPCYILVFDGAVVTTNAGVLPEASLRALFERGAALSPPPADDAPEE